MRVFHYSCALTYLLITFFLLALLSSILSLFLFCSHSGEETYPKLFFPIFLVSFLDTRYSLSHFLLSSSHALSHIRTHTHTLFCQSLIFPCFFFFFSFFFITAFLFFILSRYSNTYVVTRGRASMSIFWNTRQTKFLLPLFILF